jgi:hypothetical protein
MFALLHPDEKVIDLTRGGDETRGMTINVPQTFQSGVSHAELAAESAKIKRDTISAVMDGISRGGTFRRNMQR